MVLAIEDLTERAEIVNCMMAHEDTCEMLIATRDAVMHHQDTQSQVENEA